MKKIKTRDIIFVCVGVAFLIFVGVSMNLSKDVVKTMTGDFYVNEKGEKWELPVEGKFEFTASSGQYPKFLSGVVDPLKVKVGDTQTFTIKIASPVLMKSVRAVTQTDTKTQEVELQLSESKALSADYFRNQPYLVNEQNELIINNTNANYAEKAIEQIIAKAEAQALTEYTYVGSWVVNDTHTKMYRTTFIAENEKGEKNQTTLAWSDPNCNFNANGTLQESCAFSSGVEGFDGGNISIPREMSVTVTGSGMFVSNGGGSGAIQLQSGSSINISSGGSIGQGPLFFATDRDGDSAPADIEFVFGGGGVRVRDSVSAPWLPGGGKPDCDDNNASIYPTNPLYYPERIDADCSFNDASRPPVPAFTPGIVLGDARGNEPTADVIATELYAARKDTPEICEAAFFTQPVDDDCGVYYEPGYLIQSCEPIQISAVPIRQTAFLKGKSFAKSMSSLFVKEAKALPIFDNGWFSDPVCQECIQGQLDQGLTVLCH